MKVQSSGSAIATVILTEWRDLYAFARLVKENKPFKTVRMELEGETLQVEFIPGREEEVGKEDLPVSEIVG